MKQIIIVAISILLLASCKKESTPVTRSITNSLQSDPDLSLPPLACGVGGGALLQQSPKAVSISLFYSD